MENYNDTESYIKTHIERVRSRLRTVINLLDERMINHDKSKLKDPELSLWKQMDEEPRYKYGTREYDDKIQRYKHLFELHYSNPNNRHHPEHFINGINDFTLIDLIEMVCDWTAYKDNMRISEAIEMIEKQTERFGYSEEIRNVLTNTIVEIFTTLNANGETEERINKNSSSDSSNNDFRRVNLRV